MNASIKLLTSIVGVATLLAPLAAHADEPPPEPIEIAIKIESVELGPDVASRLELDLYGPMSEMLKSQAFEVQGPGGAPLSVRTSLSYLDETNRNYAVHIDFIDAEGAMIPLVDGFVCTACTERRLVEQTLASFRLASTRVHGAIAGEPPDVTPAPQLAPPPLEPIGALGYTGIGTGAGGLLMVIIGTGLLASESSEHPSADVVLGIGVTALGFGIAAIVGDVVSRRRASDRPHRARIEPAPAESGIAFKFGL